MNVQGEKGNIEQKPQVEAQFSLGHEIDIDFTIEESLQSHFIRGGERARHSTNTNSTGSKQIIEEEYARKRSRDLLIGVAPTAVLKNGGVRMFTGGGQTTAALPLIRFELQGGTPCDVAEGGIGKSRSTTVVIEFCNLLVIFCPVL